MRLMHAEAAAAGREIARELDVNLLGYDYSGYGCSSGQPSVLNALADIEACYDWLRSRGQQPQDIVAYGQSVRLQNLPRRLGGPPPTCSSLTAPPEGATPKWQIPQMLPTVL